MKIQSMKTFSCLFGVVVVLGSWSFGNRDGWCQTKPTMNAAKATDQQISDKIDDEMRVDPGVISTRIDVRTTDGIVQLSGTVNNLLASERAVKIAEAVKGVRAVVNEIEVHPLVDRTDQEIRRDVNAALLSDPATDSYEIDVTVNDGQVQLQGEVQSFQERNLVQTVAKGVRGVQSIDDQIIVEYRSDRPDPEIRAEIDQLFKWDVWIPDHLIAVEVASGDVTLSGTVGSAAEKRQAESRAWVAGVNSVDAQKLEVQPWARDAKLRKDKFAIKSDKQLAAAVRDALIYDPRVKLFNVDVNVKNSIVTLRGEVDNLKAKRVAERDALNTVGVVSVSNRLKVRTEKRLNDQAVADQIRAALIRDPLVERFDITISVLDGTAYLYGTVDTIFEKTRADEIASRVTGVADVDNLLHVQLPLAYVGDPYVDDTNVTVPQVIDFEPRVPLMSDAEIKQSIESELWWSPFVSAQQVVVTVDNGIATLKGTVDTWNERQAATENAYEGGATLVDNDLAVETQ